MLNIQKSLDELRELYSTSRRRDSVGILLQGRPGTGKTTTLLTGPRPILVYAFDPSYEALDAVKRGIDEGWLYVVLLNNEDSSNPTEYKKFRALARKHLDSGFLNAFGTVGIDVLTGGSGGLVEAVANEVRHNPAAFGITEKTKRPVGGLFQGDYPPVYDTIRSWIRQLQTIDAVFVCTAHTNTDKDELTGRIVTDIDTFKGLRIMIPALFAERYHMTKEQKKDGVEYKLYTNSVGGLDASTRIGGGKFDVEEVPNLCELLKKAGRRWEHKQTPSLNS